MTIPDGYTRLPAGVSCKCIRQVTRTGFGDGTDGLYCCNSAFYRPSAPTPDERIRSELDRWWAQRWIDKATPGELAAMRELLA